MSNLKGRFEPLIELKMNSAVGTQMEGVEEGNGNSYTGELNWITTQTPPETKTVRRKVC